MWDLMPYYLFFSFMFMLYGNMRNRTSIELSKNTSHLFVLGYDCSMDIDRYA